MTKEYPKIRNYIAATCFIYLLIRLSSIDADFKIPFFNIKLPSNGESLVILVLILAYFLVRIVIEWFSADKAPRKLTTNRIDFVFALILGLAPVFLTIYDKTKGVINYPESIFSVVILLVLGEFVAMTTDTQLTSLRFIRSKSEASRKSLPRIPIAVSCLFPFSFLNLVIICLLYWLSPKYLSEPLVKFWPIIFFLPLIIHVPNILLTAFVKKGELVGGMKNCFDMHDTSYQVFGFATQYPCDVTPLYKAAENGDITKVKEELEKGANPDEKNTHGWTPFLISVANGHLLCARILLDYGANVNSTNNLGRNALMFASKYGFIDIVELLLQNGAVVETSDKFKTKTPLMTASEEGHIEIVQALLHCGADPVVENREGMSAIKYAEKNNHGNLCKILRMKQKLLTKVSS